MTKVTCEVVLRNSYTMVLYRKKIYCPDIIAPRIVQIITTRAAFWNGIDFMSISPEWAFGYNVGPMENRRELTTKAEKL